MDEILRNIYSDSNPFASDPTVTFTIATVVTVNSIAMATGDGGGDVVLSKTMDEALEIQGKHSEAVVKLFKVLLDEGNLQLVNFTSSVPAENSRIYLAFQLNTKMPSNRLIYSIGLTGMLPSTVDYRLTEQQYHTSTSLNYNTGLSHSWYKNKDVSLGSWFIGLDVEHIDERSLCYGTPPRSLYNNAKEGAETPHFEAHELEANDLQETVVQYLQCRGTGKNVQDERLSISGEFRKTYWAFNSMDLQAFRKLIQQLNVMKNLVVEAEVALIVYVKITTAVGPSTVFA
ncbi:hypothetical protein T459_21901 [Capsicum annuum]|uniref:Uncharacterized protein n=1 Tax=Capsicum annuum TaxID=4072 RepID=A0A2G2YY01_CAPAN|nr:hypothetical protein T459_21901 [Capsicum annuum]